MDKYKTVDQFLAGLNEEHNLQVTKLRGFILSTNDSLVEHIKWNAPSYMYNGEDRITFNLLNKAHVVQLVFHMGATRKEGKKGNPIFHDARSIEWVSDIRGYATFKGLDEIISNEASIKHDIEGWLAIDEN